MRSQISLCRIHDNSVSKLLQEGKGGTLFDVVTHQKAISQKASLLLLGEDTCYFTMGPYWLPNITLQNTRKQCQQTVPRKEGCNSVRWRHTSERNLSECFSLVIIWRYFLFHQGPLWAPKYHFAEYTTTVLANCSKKSRVDLCVIKSHIRKQFLRKLPSSYYVRIFPFTPRAPMGSEISLCRFHEKSVSKLLPEV